MKKIFVLLRDKLGDTVIAFQALAAYRAAHPDDEITLMVHAHYLPIFAREKGYRLIPYRSYAQAIIWAFWQRICFRHFDTVLVLRGFGEKVAKLAKMLPANQRIHALNRYPEVFESSPTAPDQHTESAQIHIAPAMRGLQVLDATLVCPEKLYLAGLSHYRKTPETVVICPVSDEIRRTLSPEDVARLIPAIQQRHPGLNLRILVRNSGEGGFVSGAFAGAEVVAFGDIDGLLRQLGQAAAYYGSDTGLYHIAAAMDLPSVIFFGPSQPYKVILPAQKTEAVRLEALGQTHCDNKACQTPVCIHRAVANWAGKPAPDAPTPENCPLNSQ